MGSSETLQATRTPYLFRRGRMFYFRMSLPQPNQDSPAPRWDVCFSLATSDPVAAKMLAARIASRLVELKAESKMELANQNVRDRLRELARAHFLDEMAILNERIELNEGEPDWDVEAIADFVEKEIKKMHQAFMKSAFPQHVVAQADRLLGQCFADSKPDLEICNYLRKMLMRSEMESLRIYRAKVRADFSQLSVQDELFRGLDIDAIRPVPEVTANGKMIYPETHHHGFVPLEDAVKKFIASKAVKGKNSKTLDDIQTTLKLFRLMMPELTHVRQITKATIQDFEIELAAVPANYSKNKKLKGLTFAALKLAGQDLPKFSDATYDKYAITLRGFIKWCQHTDLLDGWKLMPFEPKNKKGAAKSKRHPFKEDELKALFASPQYTGHAPDMDSQRHRDKPGQKVIRDGFYWVPVVGLYTGMRLAEIIQLHVADLKEENGIAFFNVTVEGGGKSLKNFSSERKVPLHPELHRLGFPAYVKKVSKAGKKRIFHDTGVTAKGNISDPFSKYFGRYLTRIGIKHPKLVFHSLRHTFIDQCLKQAKLQHTYIKALVGHEEDSITFGTYGGELSVAELHEAISQVAYPVHLKA